METSEAAAESVTRETERTTMTVVGNIYKLHKC